MRAASARDVFAQCRTYGYDIHTLSRAEDLVVVEDMASQPRVLADGRVVEYGAVYEMLRAIARGALRFTSISSPAAITVAPRPAWMRSSRRESSA